MDVDVSWTLALLKFSDYRTEDADCSVMYDHRRSCLSWNFASVIKLLRGSHYSENNTQPDGNLLSSKSRKIKQCLSNPNTK